MKRFALLLRLVFAAAVLPAAAGAGTQAGFFDPPTIVFDQSIGDVRLGMSRSQVESLYGGANRGQLKVLSNYFPRRTKYAGKPLLRMTYRLHGGTLTVEYVDGKVKVVATTSPYYRTAGRVGVGAAIPLGPCHRNTSGSCNYRWHGFSWDGECGHAWLRGNRRVATNLYTRQGHVSTVQIGDPDVILYCY